MNHNKQTRITKPTPAVNGILGNKDILDYSPLLHIIKTGQRRENFQTNDKGEIYFYGYRDYIQEYIEKKMEWLTNGINIDNSTYAQAAEFIKIKNNALEFSGLDFGELNLIAYCRIYSKYDAFRHVNVYSKKLCRFLDDIHEEITITCID